jgi:hypothetical protein
MRNNFSKKDKETLLKIGFLIKDGVYYLGNEEVSLDVVEEYLSDEEDFIQSKKHYKKKIKRTNNKRSYNEEDYEDCE